MKTCRTCHFWEPANGRPSGLTDDSRKASCALTRVRNDVADDSFGMAYCVGENDLDTYAVLYTNEKFSCSSWKEIE